MARLREIPLLTRRGAVLLSLVALLVGSAVDLPSLAAESAEEVRDRAQAMTEELADAETRIGELEQEISTVRHDQEVARRELGRLREQVEESAVAQYTRPDTGDLLADTADVNEQLRVQTILQIVTQGDVDAIDQYAAARAQARTASTELEGLLADQEEAVADLEAKVEELQAELARLEELERRRREEAARRAAEAARAEREAEAEAEQATSTPSSQPAPGGGGGSGWLCPVPGSTFVDSWGAPRGGGRSHQGVDMMAPSGTPIYAPVGGNLSPNQNSLGGLAWYLYGNDGDTYYGAHLSAYGKTGRVNRGDLIGYVGNTGDARYTAPHLHFEIHPGGGAAVNPTPRVAAAC